MSTELWEQEALDTGQHLFHQQHQAHKNPSGHSKMGHLWPFKETHGQQARDPHIVPALEPQAPCQEQGLKPCSPGPKMRPAMASSEHSKITRVTTLVGSVYRQRSGRILVHNRLLGA